MNLKLFGKDAVIYAIGNAGTRGVSFLVIPLYTYGLSVDDYGRLATLLLTIQILIMLMEMGSKKAFIRFAAEYKQQNLLGRLLTCSILINVLGGLLVSVIVITWLLPLFREVLHTQEVFTLVVLTCITALTQSLCTHIMSYYLINNESVRYVTVSVAAPVLLIVLNGWFLVVLHKGIEGALVAQVITYSGVALLIMYDFFSRHRMQASLAVMRKLSQFGFPLILAMSGNLITETSGIYLLSYYGSMEQVAVFSLGNKIAQIAIMLLILPFQFVYEPFVYANIHAPGIQATIGKLLTYLMLGSAFVAFAIVFVFRDLFPIIAPDSYFPAYSVIFLLLPGIAFRGVYYVGESLLHIKNKTKVTGSWVLIFSVLSVALNYSLIPRCGMYGVIAAINTVNVFLAVVIMVLGMKTFPITLEVNRLLITALVGVTLLATVFLMHESRAYVFYTVVPIVACGCTVFLFAIRFFDEREKRAMRDMISDFGLTLHRVAA